MDQHIHLPASLTACRVRTHLDVAIFHLQYALATAEQEPAPALPPEAQRRVDAVIEDLSEVLHALDFPDEEDGNA